MEVCMPFFADNLRLKRKCEESDANMIEHFEKVSLSPPNAKKLRQDFGSTSYSHEFCSHLHNDSEPACPPDLEIADVPPSIAVPEIDLRENLSEPLLDCPVNDERAIVLYKQVHTPLIVGGPSAEPQVMVHSRILSSGILDASNLVNSRNEWHLPWLHEFRGGESVSCHLEETQSTQGSAQVDQLAMVPWVSHTPTHILNSQTRTEVADVDVEAMDDDSGLNSEAVYPQAVHPQLKNIRARFCYEPWQQYGVPQPLHSSAMWSH